MIKKVLLLASLIFIVFNLKAQKALKFNKDKSYKILQFTDVHYRPGKLASDTALLQINEALDAEKPDFVVFSGDLAWGKPAKACFDTVLQTVISRKIPWAYVNGNHDDEQGWTRKQIMDYVVEQPYNYTMHGDKSLKGEGNYILEVKKADNNDSIGALLYFFDTGSYSPKKNISKYDWLDLNQINWYTDQTNAYTQSNNGNPYPALAFFHIPLFEYSVMTSQENQGNIVGTKKEKECNPKLNTGMFAAMVIGGDVMATFCGHDHDNDYIGMYQGIALAYGRYSGGNTVYNNLGKNGCRVINLKEGERGFDTYIRLWGGEKLYPVSYPDSFRSEK